MSRTSTLVAVASLVLAAIGCAAPEDEATPSENVAIVQQAQVSNGFVCTDTRCVCNEDATGPVDSCRGMSKLCELLGRGMLCAPDGWCSCNITIPGVAATGGTGPKPVKPIVVAPSGTTVAAP